MKKSGQKYNTAGIALIEVIVSTLLFVIILLSMTQIFQMILIGQRRAIAAQNVQESLKYFFEVISKEIRMSRRVGAVNTCLSGSNILPNKRFGTSTNEYGDILYLKNYHGECVAYYLASDNGVIHFYVDRGDKSGYLSPQKIEVEDLRFSVHEEEGEQAYVTINLRAHSVGGEAAMSEMRVQTTISSRYYKSN